MSHFTKIKTEIKDISALESACLEMGFVMLENAKARGYGSSYRNADYVIELVGPYDIAVNQEKDGTFSLENDWWAGHVEKEVGKNYGRLLQLYGVHKTIAEAKRRGYKVKRNNLEDGTIKLSVGGV